MDAKFCSQCGAELREGALFYSSCGASLTKEEHKPKKNKGIFDYYKDAIKRYADFTGRASLRDYWMFVVSNFIVSFIVGVILFALAILLVLIINDYIPATLLVIIGYLAYIIFLIVPSAAISVRRLHDQNKSGAWYFIIFIPYVGAIILLVLMCLQGTVGTNRYGEVSES